jgi:hypothetical protein
MAKFALLDNKPGYFIFECPGCGNCHYINTNPKYGTSWTFNGDVDKPTVSPSILVGSLGEVPRCHSFIKDGNIQFLSDCDHLLKNQTVEIPEFN